MNSSLLFLLLSISTVHSCLVVQKSVQIPDCLCPKISFLSQESIRKNKGGSYLGYRQTWAPIIESEEKCVFNILCPGAPVVTSFYTIMFRSNGSPIYINRVIDNDSTWFPQPRIIEGIDCKQHTDGSYQWFFHDYPVFNMSFACQADVDSCFCPDISINNEGKYETVQRYPYAPDQCSLFMAYGKTDETDYSFFEPIVYSTERPISSGDVSGVVLFEELICINEDRNDFNWYYFNKKLKNVSIGWNTILNEYGSKDVCSCGAFPAMPNTDVLKQYDKNGQFEGSILGRNMFNASCNFKFVCDQGFDGVVFSDNEEPLIVDYYNVSCVFNPMIDGLKIWLVNGVRVLNPMGACLKTTETNPIPLPDCKCPPIKLMGQADIQQNLGGSYLGHGLTWDPELGYSNEYPCYFNVFCPPIATNFLTILLRSNGNPIYINRVIDDQGTFVSQPREVGSFKCAQHTDGSYQWHFHDYPVTDLGFACQTDVVSCSCPKIKVDGNSGASVEVRYPDAWNQCSLYSAECSGDGKLPFLYSTDTTIDTGAVYGTVYDDLVCIDGGGDGFNWYFSNKKLENVTIGCNSVQDEFKSPSVCECGAFPIIDNSSKLIKYDKTQKYIGAQIGTNSWTPDCQFFLTCEEGFIGVVFSDNYDPIELTGNYITCTYNPMSNYLRIWVVNSVRLINPAGGCLKKL